MVENKIRKYQGISLFGIMPGLLLILLCTGGYAQKIEMEERIPVAAFPEEALQQVQKDFPDRRRVKFFRELSTRDSLTYEAKLRSDGHWYSVEFFPDGTLLDIEKKVKFKSLPDVAQETIRKQWQQDFTKFKVIKCQEQRSDKGIRYEIEVRGKNRKGAALYQYLFAADGTFIRQEGIALRSSDMSLY